MKKIEFQKAGRKIEVTTFGVDEYGALKVEGKVGSMPFVGRYHNVGGGRYAIEFWQPVRIGRQEIGGVEPIGPAKDELDRILAEERGKQAEAAQAYRDAQPEWFVIAVGGDTGRVYVFPHGLPLPENLPLGVKNRAAEELAERIENLGVRAYELLRLGEKADARTGGPARLIAAQELVAALEKIESELGRAEAEQPAPATPAAEQDDRPVVVLNRCWECGRVFIARIPEGIDRREVERWIAEGHRRELEGAGNEPLASVGFQPEPAPWRVALTTFYCGC